MAAPTTLVSEETPQYLYKILSLRNWQLSQSKDSVALSADDEAFIHFSKEDQVDRIVSKYWAEAPQIVILKIATDQLQGNLVYETNPGGNAKYYHLYQGLIPLASVVESKIIYRKPLQNCSQQTRELVQMGDPVLRVPARELSTQEILSPQIQDLIEVMKATMRAASGVGLAAPQIGEPLQLAVIEDLDHAHLTAEQLQERERSQVPFHVIINPKLYVEGADTAQFFEGCLSIPGFMGIVPRALSVRLECLNEKAEPCTITAKDWYARILQHEIDHLNGILYLDRALLPTIMTEENYSKYWKGKTIAEIIQALPTHSLTYSASK